MTATQLSTTPVSMTVLFPACVDVLRSFQMPLHYKNLTKLAIKRLGITCHKRAFEKCSEDVREKLLRAGGRGTAYIGAPLCYGVIRSWFISEQSMLNFDEIRIPGNATAGIAGAYEALMRPMVQRKLSVPASIRNESKARGKVIEHHVYEWFKKQWPRLVLPPTNADKWQAPAADDFRLQIEGRMIAVDVFGPLRDGTYGNPYHKKPADIHLGCRVEGADILWHSVVPGHQFTDTVIPALTRSPLQMVVWLNCVREGIDYRAISTALHERTI